MKKDEFKHQLNLALELMKEEKFKDALNLLEALKNIEKATDFDYSLTHKLYQLLSNCQSLHNQNLILNHIKEISKIRTTITFHELNQLLTNDLTISDAILVREIELLILRGLLSCKIEGNRIIF